MLILFLALRLHDPFVEIKHSAIGTPTLLFPVEIIATQETKIQVPIGEVRVARLAP